VTHRATLSAPPRFLSWLWPLLDRIVSRCLGIKPLRKDKTGIINTELRRHRGQPVRLDDGTLINAGDRLLEIHLNNAWFLHNREELNGSAGEVRWRVASAFADDLRYLAGELAEGLANGVTALHGKTTLHSPVRRLGFTTTEIPDSLYSRLNAFYLNGLRQAYYFGKNGEHATHRKPPTLSEMWMSKSRLMERYRQR
jgi:hypothetical protein